MRYPRSRVQLCTKKAHTSIQVQRRQSGIPCAMVLRLMPCSPRRRIRLVTVAAGLRPTRSGWIESPPAAWHQQRVPGPHGFAVRETASFVLRAGCIAHGSRPALRSRLRADAAASTASHPAFVTIAIRPSCREGTGRADRTDLPDGESEIFFADRAGQVFCELICPSGQLVAAKTPQDGLSSSGETHRLAQRTHPVRSPEMARSQDLPRYPTNVR